MAEKKSNAAASVVVLKKDLDALVAQVAALNARLEKLEAAGSAMPAAVSASVAEPVAQPISAQPQVPAGPVAAQASAPEPINVEPAKAETAKVEPTKQTDEFSEELLLVLSAAVAAYLGKRPHIRAIRLVGSSAWAQQGRVFVQASHQLNVPHEA